MTFSLAAEGVRAILLDIEGTTTAVAFVHDVLFPFARTHLLDHLTKHFSSQELSAAVSLLRAEHATELPRSPTPPPWPDQDAPRHTQVAGIAAYVHWLMDRDRKSTGLKSLQGQIWTQGYLSGRLRGHVFDDVPPALERWLAQDVDVRIFSSGSVLAQRLLFGYSEKGDLTKFFRGYFDTEVGPKTDPDSYRRITEQFRRSPNEILFLSDVTRELNAARLAGLGTLLCVRPSNPEQPSGHGHRIIGSFGDLVD